MPDLTLSRHFNAPIDKVFAALTEPRMLLEWWGPEGMRIEADPLDFTKTGPWCSTMINAEGQRFKVSGQVTHVAAPHSVGFTWAWHDETDARGAESHVSFKLTETPTGTEFVLSHVDLPTPEAVAAHEQGWTSSLRKLEHMHAPA